MQGRGQEGPQLAKWVQKRQPEKGSFRDKVCGRMKRYVEKRDSKSSGNVPRPFVPITHHSGIFCTCGLRVNQESGASLHPCPQTVFSIVGMSSHPSGAGGHLCQSIMSYAHGT